MNVTSARHARAGFTIAEIMIGVTVLAAVGMAGYSMLLNSSMLFAKNVSLNTSSTVLRTALDRMYIDVNQAYGMPQLINADGGSATTSSAAGIAFDVYLGGPYVITNPAGAGLPSSTVSFTMKCPAPLLPIPTAAEVLTTQPTPVVNDVVVLDNGITRPVVNTCTSSTLVGVRTLTVGLKSSLGNQVSWNASTTKTGFLVHKRAYVVATVGGHGELRLYNNAEAVPDYSDPANYVVLARDLSGLATNNENTPFSVVPDPLTGTNFLNIAMRVEDQSFNKALALKQSKEFNTFLQLDTRLRPRN
jgi:hypothetical protein